MSTASQVARNTIIQFAGKIIGLIFALVTLGIILRYLGQEGFGQYTTIITYVSIFSIIADLGLYLIVTREISKDDANENKILSNAFTIKLLCSIIILIVAYFASFLFPYSNIIKTGIIIASFSFLFILLNQILIGLFQKHFAMHWVALGEILSRFIWLVGAYMVIRYDMGLYYLLVALTIGNFFNFLIVFLASRKFVQIKFAYDKELWKKIFKMAAPLAFSVVFNLVYFKIATIFLSILKTQKDVGIYGAPFKILESLIAFAAIFAGLLLPLLSKFYKENTDKFREIFKKGTNVLIIFVIPMCVGTIFFAREIMELAGGEEFADSNNVLKILIFAVGAIFFSHLFGNTAIACNQQKKIMWVYMVTAILSVILNVLLIPKLSYYGASIAVTVSEVFVATVIFILIYLKSKVTLNYKIFFKSLASVASMLLVLLVLPKWHFTINVFLGSATYFLILYLLRGFSKEMVLDIINIKKKS